MHLGWLGGGGLRGTHRMPLALPGTTGKLAGVLVVLKNTFWQVFGGPGIPYSGKNMFSWIYWISGKICLTCVQNMCKICAKYVQSMCAKHVQSMCKARANYVQSMCKICSKYVCKICAKYVQIVKIMSKYVQSVVRCCSVMDVMIFCTHFAHILT